MAAPREVSHTPTLPVIKTRKDFVQLLLKFRRVYYRDEKANRNDIIKIISKDRRIQES